MCCSQLQNFLSHFPFRNNMQIKKYRLKVKTWQKYCIFYNKDGYQMEEMWTALAAQQRYKHNWLQMEVPRKGNPFILQKLVSVQVSEG